MLWERVDQKDRLPIGNGFLYVRLRGGCHPHQKSEQVQVIRPVAFGGELVDRDECRCLEQAARLPAELRNLALAGDQVADDLAAMPAQCDVVMVRVGKRSRV